MIARLLIFIAIGAAVHAQPFVVSISLQPLEAFKSAFLERLPGVAMYDALVCNSGPAPATVNAGLILQAAQSMRISVIDARLITATVSRARSRSKLSIAASTVGWLSDGAALTTSSGLVKSDLRITAGTVILGRVAATLAGVLAKSGSDPSALLPDFLDPRQEIPLGARACDSRLLLGGFVRDFAPATKELP